MNIPQSSTDYTEEIRSKRTEDYNTRVEGYFSDNKKIIEINKYLAVHGDKNTVKKYELDEEDMSDIIGAYIVSLLECEEELFVIQSKIQQATEEQKKDVLLRIQREYWLNDEELEDLLERIQELKSTTRVVEETKDRAQIVLVEWKIRKPRKEKETLEQKIERIQREYVHVIREIKFIWPDKRNFMAASRTDLIEKFPRINEVWKSIHGHTWKPLGSTRYISFLVTEHHAAQKRLADLIYPDDKIESSGSVILQRQFVSGDKISPIFEYQTRMDSHESDKMQDGLKAEILWYKEQFESLCKSRISWRLPRLFQLLNDVLIFVENQSTLLGFDNLKTIFENFFENRFVWMRDYEQLKWHRHVSSEMFSLLKSKVADPAEKTVIDQIIKRSKGWVSQIWVSKKWEF